MQKRRKWITMTSGQCDSARAARAYLPAENISEFGSAFALAVFVLCETEELSNVCEKTIEIFKSFLRTFWRNKYFTDKIGGECSHFAVFHPHPPSIFNLWSKYCEVVQVKNVGVVSGIYNIHTFQNKQYKHKQTTNHKIWFRSECCS